jgi:hypothetical protein
LTSTCDRCGRPAPVAGAGVPATGLAVTCGGCGHVFRVPPPPAAEDEQERFFRGASPSPGPPASGEWADPPVPPRSRAALLAAGALVVVALVAGGAWLAGRREAGSGAAGGGDRPPANAGIRPEPSRREAPPGAGVAEGTPGGAPPARAAAAAPPPAPGSPARRAPGTGGKADRRLLDLLDRKEDAALAGAPAAGELSTGRASLDEATLRGALAANSNAFSACIAKAIKADPGLRLQARPVVLELVVEPTGRVSRATVEDPRYASTPLGECFAATARRMVFPSFDGDQILVQAPLKLSAVQ